MDENQEYNPLRSVQGFAIPCPYSYVWILEDVSGRDAGRTEDTVMDKKRIGQVVGIELKWRNVSIEDAATILTAFNPEYISVCYLDAQQGKYVTSEFYVGNRNSPLYNARLRKWKEISLKIIERDGRNHNV